MPGHSAKLNIQDRFSERVQAERYRDRFSKPHHRRTHEREARALDSLLASLTDVSTALDVGSGPGRFVPTFAARGIRLIQTDYSGHMLAVSRDGHPPGSQPGDYVRADARRLPFAEGVVDLVFCHRLLNHIPVVEDRRQVLSNLARASRKYVVVSCLTPPGFVRAFRRIYERIRGVVTVDGHVGDEDLERDAREIGLRLTARQPIRSLLRSAAYMVFVKG
jgi:SAM-dependent methyltransferase